MTQSFSHPETQAKNKTNKQNRNYSSLVYFSYLSQITLSVLSKNFLQSPHLSICPLILSLKSSIIVFPGPPQSSPKLRPQGVSTSRTNSVNQVDGISDMAPTFWLYCSVGRGFRKGTVASTHLSVWEKAVLQLHLDARQFSSSLYAASAFQAATPVLELRWSESNSVCEFFKRNCLGLQKFLPPAQSLLVVAATS